MPSFRKVRSKLPSRLWVNPIAGFAEVEFVGCLSRGALEERVKSWLNEMEARAPDSFTRPPKAVWRLSWDCNAKKDKYSFRVAVRSTPRFEAAAAQYQTELERAAR
jgi:hypothetical protein